MSLRAMLSPPLLAGNDLSLTTPETKAIPMNRDVIAVDQDALGRRADEFGRRARWRLGEELRGGKTAIAFFSRGESAMDFDPNLRALADFKGKHFLNLRAKSEFVFDAVAALRVPSHGVLLLEQR